MGPFTSHGARVRALVLVLLAAPAAAAAPKVDLLAAARRFYNQAQYDRALEAATEAAASPATKSSGRLLMGRARLERFRQAAGASELEEARGDFRLVDARALDARERIEFQLGLGELLYLEDRFGPAAELLAPLVDGPIALAPDARERALDWWATALDRQAQSLPLAERALVYPRITDRMEQELRRDAGSVTATYWLAASARGSGDPDRALAAASAGWVRASLGRDRGAALRADLDKLVMLAIIPDRAARVPARDRRQAAAAMAAEWEAFKKNW